MIHPYATEIYARSLDHIGQALYVPHWETSVLIRNIDDHYKDIIGIYPITVIAEHADLKGGLDYLKKMGFISVILNLDDFNRPSMEALSGVFEFVRPFKTHYIYRPSITDPTYTKHHRYEINKALKILQVEKLNLGANLEAWKNLYSELTERHNLQSLHNFSAAHHHILAQLDKIVAFGAWKDNELVSCHIWSEHNGFVHSHLAASNETGYKSSAAYAVNDFSTRYFREANLINFGGGAGATSDPNDGLIRFKKGFSNDIALSYLCGGILNNDIYQKLLQKKGTTNTIIEFFPAYRK